MKHHRLSILILVVFIITLNTVVFASQKQIKINEVEHTIEQWLDADESDEIVYFLFQSPSHIERYDLNNELWLPEITLNATPTVFAVDLDGIYISFDRRTVRLDLDGTNETHLNNSTSEVKKLFTLNEFLYIYSPNVMSSINKLTGETIDSQNHGRLLVGIDIAPSIKKVFGRSQGISPSDIYQINLNADGTLGTLEDSPYHGNFPGANQVFVLANDSRVADNSGIIYNTTDLTYSNSFETRFEDITFYGDLPIIHHDGTLIAYSNVFEETGRHKPEKRPWRIFEHNKTIYSFTPTANGTKITKIPVSLLTQEIPNEPVNPQGLQYNPDAVVIGNNEVVYFLSRKYLSLFRWSISEKRYLETFPLQEAPIHMAYIGSSSQLFLAYPSEKVTLIDASQTTLIEEDFITPFQSPCGLFSADEYLVTCNRNAGYSFHSTYNPDGALISTGSGSSTGAHTWSPINHKLYYFSQGSPTDLFWQEIDENGVFGAEMDSPYHDSDGMIAPIRVASDGSSVLIGSGRIYNGISLEQTGALSNDIADGLWINNTLFTLKENGAGTHLQKWRANFNIEAAQTINGVPIRMFPTNEGILVITSSDGKPLFSIWDTDLNNVYSTPTIHLPVVAHNYCADLYDNFSNPVSGWPIGEDSLVRTEYLNGEYRILTKEAGYLYLFKAPTCNRHTYTVETDVRWNGTPANSYGLIFGVSGNFDHYFIFDINTDTQQYRLLRRTPGGLESIINPRTNSVINGGSATNHLKVTLKEDEILLEINGFLIDTWYTWWGSPIPTQTNAGIVSSPYNNKPNSDARFDNFKLVGISNESNNQLQFNTLKVPDKNKGAKDAVTRQILPSSLDWDTKNN